MNARGEIAGFYDDAADTTHGFLLSKGTFTTIDVPGALFTAVTDINNAGVMIGAYDDTAGGCVAGNCHGFVLRQGTFTTIDFPGASHTEVLGINDAGEIVGVHRSFGTGSCSAMGSSRRWTFRELSQRPRPASMPEEVWRAGTWTLAERPTAS